MTQKNKRWLAISVFLVINIIVFVYFVPRYANDRNRYDFYRDYPFAEKPEISAVIVPKFPDGYRLRVKTYNFSISSICTLEEAKKPVGHIHIYVNDKFFGMMLTKEHEPDLLPVLQKGKNKVTLILHAPDHKIYLYNGKLMSQTLYIDLDQQQDVSQRNKLQESRPKAIVHDMDQMGIEQY